MFADHERNLPWRQLSTERSSKVCSNKCRQDPPVSNVADSTPERLVLLELDELFSLGHTRAADTPLPLQSQTSEAPAIVTFDVKTDSQTANIAEPSSSSSDAQADIWKAIDLLEFCFPAVAPAVSVAAQQFDQRTDHPSSGKLIEIAAGYVRLDRKRALCLPFRDGRTDTIPTTTRTVRSKACETCSAYPRSQRNMLAPIVLQSKRRRLSKIGPEKSWQRVA